MLAGGDNNGDIITRGSIKHGVRMDVSLISLCFPGRQNSADGPQDFCPLAIQPNMIWALLGRDCATDFDLKIWRSSRRA